MSFDLGMASAPPHRSNSDLNFLKTNSLRRALLVDQEFESARLKLEILRKFEKSMLAERSAETRLLLDEMVRQNDLLGEIRLAMEERSTGARGTFRNSVVESSSQDSNSSVSK